MTLLYLKKNGNGNARKRTQGLYFIQYFLLSKKKNFLSYEENEDSTEKNKLDRTDMKIASQIKKLLKEKQAKMLHKQSCLNEENDESVLILDEEKKVS